MSGIGGPTRRAPPPAGKSRKSDVILLQKVFLVRGNSSMNWVRSTIRPFARLALFALAVQMVVSFGHMHPDDLGLQSFATAHWAHFPSGVAQALTSPTDGQQYPSSDDYCPICASMALLATGAPSLPPVIVAPPPISRVWSSRISLHFVARKTTFSFQARAPPLA
jgi:hypothetical protein